MTKPTITTPAKYVEIDGSKLPNIAAVLAMRSVLISIGINPHLLSKVFGYDSNAGFTKAIPGYDLVQWGVAEHGDVVFPCAMQSDQYQIVGFGKDGNSTVIPISKPLATGVKFAGYAAYVAMMKTKE